MAARLEVTLLWFRPHCFCHANALVRIRPTWLRQQKQRGLYQNKVTSSLVAIQRPGHWVDKCKMVYSYPGHQEPQKINSSKRGRTVTLPHPHTHGPCKGHEDVCHSQFYGFVHLTPGPGQNNLYDRNLRRNIKQTAVSHGIFNLTFHVHTTFIFRSRYKIWLPLIFYSFLVIPN